jgi:hypothetical protein
MQEARLLAHSPPEEPLFKKKNFFLKRGGEKKKKGKDSWLCCHTIGEGLSDYVSKVRFRLLRFIPNFYVNRKVYTLNNSSFGCGSPSNA